MGASWCPRCAGWIAILSGIFLFEPQARGSEEAARKRFHAKYWDVVSEERLAALDPLANVREDRSHWILYTVSFWDPEPAVRRKAFRMLVGSEDRVGHVSYLASRSFRLERDPDMRAEKAGMMAGLRFKWHALSELCAFASGARYPRYEYPADAYDDARPHRWWVWVGRTKGIGVMYGDPWRGRDAAGRMARVLEAINVLGKSRFEARPGEGRRIGKWWREKDAEFREVDRRLGEKIRPQNRAQATAGPPGKAASGAFNPLMIPQLERDALKREEDLDAEED
jgi:hypothetical protein